MSTPLPPDVAWRENWKARIRSQARIQVPQWLRSLGTRHLEPLPVVKLLPPPDIRDTRELVSSAVRWFFERHRYLPETAVLNPLRCLAICEQRFFAIDCEEMGGYTIQIEQSARVPCDGVRLRGHKIPWKEMQEDYYL